MDRSEAQLRAQNDVADIKRRIEIIKREEDRLAEERQLLESERDKILAFIEMFETYVGTQSALDYAKRIGMLK